MNQVCNPEWMTFNEQMTEVAGILAAGILRRRKRQMREMQRNHSFSANGLDVFAGKSVHVDSKPRPEEENR